MVRTRLAALAAGVTAAASLLVATPASAAVPGGAVCATHVDSDGRGVYLTSDLPADLQAALDSGRAPGVTVPRQGVTSDFVWSPQGIRWVYTWTQVGRFGTSGNGTPVFSVFRSVAYDQPVSFHETAGDFYWWAPNAGNCAGGFVKHHFHGTLDAARGAGFPA